MPTPADLAAALDTARKWAATTDKNEDAKDVLARWLVANAERLRVVRGLEWKSTGGGNGWYARTVFDTIIRISREGEWWYANDDYSKCRSEDRAKERADERYAARLAAALAPAFPTKGEQS